MALLHFIKEPGFSQVRLLPWLLCMGLAFVGVRLHQMRDDVLNTLMGPVVAADQVPQSSPQEKLVGTESMKPVAFQEQSPVIVEDSSEHVDLLNITTPEIKILQSLGKRRLQAEEKEAELERRSEYLKAVEARIDQKIDDLKNIQSILKQVVSSREKWEDRQLKSLIKIYEIMKPQEAAQILSGVELDVLLSVMERMREQKASAILAVMDPYVAQRITVELAERLKISDQLNRD